MRAAKFSFSLFLYILLIPIASMAQQKQDSTGSSVDSSEGAFEIVLNYTGLDRKLLLPHDQQIEQHAEKVVMNDTTIAFARQHVHGRVAWHFVFEDVVVDTNKFLNPNISNTRQIEVWVDSAQGTLLLIRSHPQSGPRAADSEPPWTEVFRPIPFLEEAFSGFPELNPRITLMDALSRCKGSHVIAEVWSAAYVNYSQEDNMPVAAWVFYFAGVPSPRTNPLGFDDVPATNQRIVVDATSGKIMAKMWYALNTTANSEPNK